jgi:BCD family chlorophyll transporter-like MFS transporter
LAAGGIIRDAAGDLANTGALGKTMMDPSLGYSVVYHLEIGFLFASLVAIGPLVRTIAPSEPENIGKIGLADLPG